MGRSLGDRCGYVVFFFLAPWFADKNAGVVGGGSCPSPCRGPHVQLRDPGGSVSENSLQPYSKHWAWLGNNNKEITGISLAAAPRSKVQFLVSLFFPYTTSTECAGFR